jgi:hypothetical protein
MTIPESKFCRRLTACGRILEDPDYNIWCCSPIDGPDGRVHVFYSRWKNRHGHGGWLTHCEVAHAVADRPEGPYSFCDVALDGTGQPGDWDGMTIHNPTVHRVGDRYVLVYIGNRLLLPEDGCTDLENLRIHDPGHSDLIVRSVETSFIGMAFADSLDSPWTRNPNNPVVMAGEPGAWDDVTADNPAFFQHPDGRFYLYYRGWNGRNGAWERGDVPRVDMLGVAIADRLEGPYVKYPGNPIIDLTRFTDRRPVGLEDPYVFMENGRVFVVTRDHGFATPARGDFEPNGGLIFESADGLHFTDPPSLAYHPAGTYYDLSADEMKLDRYGRFERPQVLMRDGRPAYLFTALRGGRFQTSSAFVHRIKPEAGGRRKSEHENVDVCSCS